MKRSWKDTVEEIEFFMGLGDTPATIAATLQARPSVIARACQRVGRPDLARPFTTLDSAQSRGHWA